MPATAATLPGRNRALAALTAGVCVGVAEGLGSSLFLLVPSAINVSSPAFEQAAKACDFH